MCGKQSPQEVTLGLLLDVAMPASSLSEFGGAAVGGARKLGVIREATTYFQMLLDAIWAESVESELTERAGSLNRPQHGAFALPQACRVRVDSVNLSFARLMPVQPSARCKQGVRVMSL